MGIVIASRKLQSHGLVAINQCTATALDASVPCTVTAANGMDRLLPQRVSLRRLYPQQPGEAAMSQDTRTCNRRRLPRSGSISARMCFTSSVLTVTARSFFRRKIKRLALADDIQEAAALHRWDGSLPERTFCQSDVAQLGHEPRIIPAIYAKPFVKGQKNDYNDAEAIAEAALRPNLRVVREKTQDQLDLQALPPGPVAGWSRGVRQRSIRSAPF